MGPRLRKFSLLAHITFSVGWFGAVIPYLALAIAGLVSHDAQMVRAACLSMELLGWFVLVPFSVAALVSGLVQSLGTKWGLVRHWWIVAKLVLTVLATLVLFRHMTAVSSVAEMAAVTTTFDAGFRAQQVQLLVHPTGGLLVLLAIMTLSVFKPWGLTAHGRRRAEQTDLPSRSEGARAVREPIFSTAAMWWPRIVKVHVLHAVAIALLLFVILHLTGGGFRSH